MDDLLKLHGQPATIDLQHEKINHDKMALMYLDLFTSSTYYQWQLARAFQQERSFVSRKKGRVYLNLLILSR